MTNKIGRPRAFTDAVDLGDRCNKYIDDCKDRDKPVTMVGLACYLGVNKDTITEYGKGVYDDDNNRFSVPLKKVLQAAEADATERLYSKHTLGAMFVLKCNHGYIERQHIDINADVKTTSIEQALDEID